MTVATLTLNPALDVTTATDRVRPTHKLRCTPPQFDAGGGGINVARALHSLGCAVTAVFPSGGPAGATIEALLEQAGVPQHAVPIAGATRESFTVDEAAEGGQYRFVLPGPNLSADEVAAVLDALRALPDTTHLVVSGSLPPGCDPAILRQIAALGVRLIVDTSGAALAACEGVNAFLLKPSLREVEDLLGRKLDGEDAEAGAARELHDRGFAETVIISLGDRGALMANGGGALRVPAVPTVPRSTVGAGDAMVAGITAALIDGRTMEQALRYGVAAGAAKLALPATDLPDRAAVDRLYAAS